MKLDATDKRLLETVQQAFPLVEEPFRELARGVGISAEEALTRVADLKARRIIREIGAIFDSRALGYQTTLVAASVSTERLEAAADVISQHPGVSHNYAREHQYNLWFTLALPPGEDLKEASEKLAYRAGADSVMVLPAVRIFKIGAFFHLSDQEEVTVEAGGNGRHPPDVAAPPALTAKEIAVVRELQQDLPLVHRPFQAMAERLAVGENRVFDLAKDFLARGLMRRFAALLYHRRLGFLANGMGCWRAPEKRLEEVGKALAAFPQVTHCYQRVTYPQWPYNLFTMVHAPTQDACLSTVRAMAKKVDIMDYLVLFSTREFKKAMVKFYW